MYKISTYNRVFPGGSPSIKCAHKRQELMGVGLVPLIQNASEDPQASAPRLSLGGLLTVVDVDAPPRCTCGIMLLQ